MLTKALDELQATLPGHIKHTVDRDTQFSPPGTTINETVYLHLGGDWDAVNEDGKIYVNVRYWTELFTPSWEGLNMVIAHETIHSVQNAAYGNPESLANADSAFLTGLSKIQREGIARYVECETDPDAYTQGTYGFVERAVAYEALRSFPKDIALTEGLYSACYPSFDQDRFANVYASGLGSGGPYYDVSHGIAKTIDERRGRKELIRTIQDGPKRYFSDYIELCNKDRSLPQLPSEIVLQVASMRTKL
jgi:hypothetical protein